jgi:hypothetical protein
MRQCYRRPFDSGPTRHGEKPGGAALGQRERLETAELPAEGQLTLSFQGIQSRSVEAGSSERDGVVAASARGGGSEPTYTPEWLRYDPDTGEYRVKWLGYTSEWNTVEPEESFADFDQLTLAAARQMHPQRVRYCGAIEDAPPGIGPLLVSESGLWQQTGGFCVVNTVANLLLAFACIVGGILSTTSLETLTRMRQRGSGLSTEAAVQAFREGRLGKVMRARTVAAWEAGQQAQLAARARGQSRRQRAQAQREAECAARAGHWRGARILTWLVVRTSGLYLLRFGNHCVGVDAGRRLVLTSDPSRGGPRSLTREDLASLGATGATVSGCHQLFPGKHALASTPDVCTHANAARFHTPAHHQPPDNP